MSDQFEVLRHEILYTGRVFTIVRDEVRHVSGYESVREVVEHDGGAVAVAVDANNEVVLIRQYRYPIAEEIIELPAGKLSPGEDPLACAQRELREETGIHASRWEKLSAMLSTPGFCSEVLHLYLARDLRAGTQALEQGEESITVLRVPLREALAMCADGRVRDGKTIAGLSLAALRLGMLQDLPVLSHGTHHQD
ncbi:MAG: NUDIX hydrolase [Bacteroidota bacterium]|jgi:ADP-ribose pyrophosphatase|nr:NUDIX hydrolase [Bacteroidota bacterium]